MSRKAKVKASTVYVVEMFEDGELVESRPMYGKSIKYAEDCAENWENGIIPSPGIDSEYELMANDFIRGQN
jgi:hypothetical protein|tara:strand:+ start:1496 stop:1708 length:213 start_codon:yes stop_codon:yes gene_type:complete